MLLTTFGSTTLRMKLSAGTSRMLNRWQCASMKRCWLVGVKGPCAMALAAGAEAAAVASVPAMKSRRRMDLSRTRLRCYPYDDSTFEATASPQ